MLGQRWNAKRMTKISVALATFCGAKFLREQLRSLARQSLLPTELVVCDDGSTDDTVAILNEFARGAPFDVRIRSNEMTLGHADNFLKAVALCRHPLVAYCDQDDVWHQDKLAIAAARLEEDRSEIALHRATAVDERLNVLEDLSQGIARDDVLAPLTVFPHHGLGWGMTLLFRRELLELVPAAERPPSPWTSGLVGHDIWTYLLAASLGRVSHIARPLILYRQHARNSSGTRRMTPREKLTASLSVPLWRYIGNENYYAGASRCFDIIAAANSRFASPAIAASATYHALAERSADRIAIYTAPGPLGRAKQLATYARRHKPPKLSLAKDVLLGVCRVGPSQGATDSGSTEPRRRKI